MKPQDLIVALVLLEEPPPETFAAIASAAGVSSGEAHAAVGRLRDAGLVSSSRRVHGARLLEFLLHGVRYAFPATPSHTTIGVPTGAAALHEPHALPGTEDGLPWVWASPVGSERGRSVEPLYAPAIQAITASTRLHQLLAMVDLLRCGRAREVEWARAELRRRLAPPQQVWGMQPVDLSRADALHEVFSYTRLTRTVERWSASMPRTPGAGPLHRAAITLLGGEIVHELVRRVPAFAYEPEPAERLRARKSDDGERELVFPCLSDALVAVRLVDEVEPKLREWDDGRAFMNRSRVRSIGARGDYRSPWFGEWRQFLESLHAAEIESGMAIRTDVRSFFPSVRRELVAQVVAQFTGATPHVLRVLMGCVATWSGRERGLPIDGFDVSATLAHALMQTVDRTFQDSFEFTYRRFVDDTVLFAASEEALRKTWERYQRELGLLELEVNASKTEFMTAGELVAAFDDPDHVQIDAALDARALAREYERLQREGGGRGSYSLRRHALSRAARMDDVAALMPLVLEDLHTCRAMRLSALRFLDRVAGPVDIAGVLGLPTRDWSEVERIAFVDMLARARLDAAAVEAVHSWARDEMNSAGSEAERSWLALLRFKVGGEASQAIGGPWSPRAESAGVIVDMLSTLTGEPPVAKMGSDRALGRRVLQRIRSGEFEPSLFGQLLVRRRRGAWSVDPEHLPLLHLAARALPEHAEPWLRLLVAGADPSLVAHARELLR